MTMNLSPQIHPEKAPSKRELAPSNPINVQRRNYETLLRLRREIRELPIGLSGSASDLKMPSKERLPAGVSFRGGSRRLAGSHQEQPLDTRPSQDQTQTPPLTPRKSPTPDELDFEQSLTLHEIELQNEQDMLRKASRKSLPKEHEKKMSSKVSTENITSRYRSGEEFSDNLLTDELARLGDDDDDGDLLTVYSFNDQSCESDHSQEGRTRDEGVTRSKSDEDKDTKPKHKSSRRPLPSAFIDGPASRNAELYKRLQIFDWSASTLTLTQDVSSPSQAKETVDRDAKKKGKKLKHHKKKKDRKMDSSCSVSRDPSTTATVATEPSTPSQSRRKKKLPSIRSSRTLKSDPVEYSPTRFNDSVQSTRSAPDVMEGRRSRRNTEKRKKKKKSSSSHKHHSRHRRRKKHHKDDKERSINRIQEDEDEDEEDDDDTDDTDLDNTERFWQSEPAVGVSDRREEFCCSGRDRTLRISNKSSSRDS